MAETVVPGIEKFSPKELRTLAKLNLRITIIETNETIKKKLAELDSLRAEREALYVKINARGGDVT